MSGLRRRRVAIHPSERKGLNADFDLGIFWEVPRRNFLASLYGGSTSFRHRGQADRRPAEAVRTTGWQRCRPGERLIRAFEAAEASIERADVPEPEKQEMLDRAQLVIDALRAA